MNPAPASIATARANIAQGNARLNIYLDLAAEGGDGGVGKGPLADFGIAVKANIAIAGLPHSAGVGAFRHRVATTDAHAVALLRAAGATLLGSVNMEEAALGATTNNPHFGRTENPHRPGVTAGGSSGGSAAAVAAGMARAALGTDTMGSCRIPAAYCGVVGFKPSFGRISLRGVEPLSARLDHVGVIAANVADVAAVTAAIAQFDGACAGAMTYPAEAAPPKTRLADAVFAVLDDNTIAALAPEVARAYRAALTALRDSGVQLVVKPFDSATLAAARRAGLLICEAELALTLAPVLADDGVSPNLRAMIAFGAAKSAPDLARAHARIDAVLLLQRQLLDGVDAILWPTAPQTAFAFAAPVPANQADFTCLANFTGAPAISLPLPVATDALPVGIQLIGARGGDAAVLALAALLEPVFAVSTRDA